MTQSYKIAVLAGDGIGPEITEQAIRVLKLIEQKRDVNFECIDAPFGASAYFSHGKSFPEETQSLCDTADAILKGPIGLSHEESEKIPVEEPDFSKEIVDRPVVPPEEPEEDTTPVEAESSTSKSWITDLKCENEKLYFLGETKVSGLELQITHTEKIISQN